MQLDAMDRRLLKVLKFLVKFNLVAIPLYLIILLEWRLVELQQLTTWITYSILSWSGMDPSLNGYLISIPIKNGTWAAIINWDCTGWKSILAFFALVMATDLPMKRKMYGLLLIPIIYLINIVRIFFMFFYVRTFDLAHYQLVHTVVWSWGLILIVLVLWTFWMKHDFTKFSWPHNKPKPGRSNKPTHHVKHHQPVHHVKHQPKPVPKPVVIARPVKVKKQAIAKPKPAPKKKKTGDNNYIPV